MRLQQGASLIEVLVTLLLVKLGLLGILAGQLLATQHIINATQRTAAVALTSSLLQDLASVNKAAPLSAVTISASSPLTEVTCSALSPCDAEQARQYLLYNWQQRWQNHSITDAQTPLFEPYFCLTASASGMTLKASWQLTGRYPEPAAASCDTGIGRAGFQLLAGGE
ncbi:hypothetical protein [Arsukibacterium sp.]|uniref:hypothetical protein n=1 Tax=Arsukibacterium sp. TaxID=1977258 RepID=UPI002FDB4F82